MNKFAITLGLLMAPLTLVAAEKQPFTVDDVYRIEQVTDFQISPTGDEAVYVRHWYDVNFAGRRTAIWRIDGATGRREPLEVGEPDGRMPVYSPDGKWLAFVSNRSHNGVTSPMEMPFPPHSEATGQLYVASLDPQSSPGAQRIENLNGRDRVLCDGFYGRIAFSRDGKKLAVVDSSPRDYEKFLAPRALAANSRLAFEDQGEGYEGHFQARTRLFDCPDASGGSFKPSAVAAESGLHDEFWHGDPQWTPDGKSLVFHANRTADQESVRYSINKNYDLWQAAVNEAEASAAKLKQLTTNPGPDVSPRISPDGKHVLYLSVPRQGPHMDVFNLCVLTLDDATPEPRVLVDAHGAERESDGTPPFQPTFPLRDDCWIDDTHVRVSGMRGMKNEVLVFNIAGPNAPITPSAKPESPLKNEHLKRPEINTWLAERYHGPQETVRWKSFDGLEIDGVLTLPPAELTQFKKPYPVIVHPHGGPHGASSPGFSINVQVFASAGYAVFQPNYRGSYGYGRKFLDAARFDMGGSDMRDILTGIDELIRSGVVDKHRQFVYGSSYGGYTACRLVTLTDQFRAVVAQNAVTDLDAMWRLSDLQSWTEWEFGGKPWETVRHDGREVDVAALMRERSPATYAHRVKTPTLLLHSDHDRRCPLPMGRMFYRLLKEAGCKTELIIYHDERHQLWQMKHQADALAKVLDWFARHTSAAAAKHQ